MAELIHTFTSGKMNKDLDERLVPNGEYRDALNLELASSDSSQVGTFQNIKGNLELRNKMYNPKTNAYNQWPEAEYITALNTPICIGAIADENSDNIYWFIASETASVIAYYNIKTKLTRPLLVDTQGVLNFSEDYLITGINVIEGILIWTDNQTEPKKIFIDDWTGSTPNFATHSQIYGRGFIEDDITVIKKYPLQPPVTEAYSTTRANPDGSPGANVDTITNTSFNYDNGGIIEPLPSGTENITLLWIGAIPPVYRVGDILLLTSNDNDELDPDAVTRVLVSGLAPGGTQNGATVTILSVGVPPEGLTLDDINYAVTLEQEPPFFEMKFARFGYRYKYENNELSAFSPFSNPVFIPGEFDYAPSQGYNLGMTNNVRQLTISDFVPSPTDYPDVVAVDILYKATNNQNVYVVDTFTNEDPEWVAGAERNAGTPEAYFVGAFDIETEIITSVVKTNQILRPFDNVPRKAKAQEITANRLLFGNYTQNFNLLNSDGSLFQNNIDVGSIHHTVSTDTAQYPLAVSIDGNQVAESIKSIRTYQVGVAYMDNYGRTTPVFTSKSASINISKEEAPSASKLQVTLVNNDNNDTLVPYYEQNKQFPYFKYYVKETSREYYNLALDRFYDAEDGNLWLSFPSAERNKVDEDTFLILKKEHDSIEPVTQTARYKVIAIENEAPTYLKETKLSMGAIATGFTAVGFPIEGTNVAAVDKALFESQFGLDAASTSGLLMRVKSGADVSNYYKISTFGLEGTIIVITTAEPFGPDMNFTSAEPYGYPNAVTGLQLELFRVESLNKPEFTGRFFVKVYKDTILEDKIASASEDNTVTYIRKALGYLYNCEFNRSDEEFWTKDDYWGGGGSQDAQNSRVRLFIDRITCAGLGIPGTGISNNLNAGGTIQISSATGYGKWSDNTGINDVTEFANRPMLRQLNTNGVLFRFIDAGNGISDPMGQVYQVTSTSQNMRYTYTNEAWADRAAATNQITRWTLGFQAVGSSQGIQWNPQEILPRWVRNLGSSNYSDRYVGIEFVERLDTSGGFTTNNPAIFETEPKEAAELDIYWEIPKVYELSSAGTTHTLDFFNCYSFGNGVESDRIRDDFNQPTIENGVKASATLDEPYNEEIRSSGIIFSQIFNSISGTNNLNQFIQAESITKDLNPEYGSIQKFHTRDTDLITLCENKSMKILAKKDALYNADGSTNLTSNAEVLGQTLTFQGEFGIATNPESFVDFGFRMYYTDATRGAVLRLSGDGITDLSDYGMHSFFSDNLPINNKIIGSWDTDKRNYNITLSSLTPYWQQTLGAGEFDRLNKDPLCDQFVNSLPTTSTTVSYKEAINGFTSRKTYIPEAGAYLDNSYYTFKSGRIWEHGVNEKRNTFYNIGPNANNLPIKGGNPYYESSFNTIFNENPAVVKGYKTLNYSGTKSKEYIYEVDNTGKKYTLAQIQADGVIPTSVSETNGWYVNSILTDLQEGEMKEFVKKEGKYFNYIKGMPTFFTTNCDTNVDSSEFNVQGIGRAIVIEAPGVSQYNVTNEVNPDCSTNTSPPVIYNQNFEVVEDIAGTFTIAQSNNCTSPITFQLGTNSTTGGTLIYANTSTFTFNPDPDYNGSAGSFTVRACCGDVCSDYAIMSIVVTPEPDSPYFSSDPPFPINGLVDGDTWSYPNITLLDNDHPSIDLEIVSYTGKPSWMAAPTRITGTDEWEIATSTVSGGASNISFTMVVEDPDGNQGEQTITGTTADLPVPDTTRAFITTWKWGNFGAVTNIEPESSAQDAKCLIDDFYETANQQYNLVSNTAVSFKYFDSDGLEVGTQMYDSSTNAPITSPGVYLFAGGVAELTGQNGEPGLDITNPAPVPSSFYMMVLNGSGIITDYIQYSQLAICEDPCLMWPEDQTGYPMTEGYTSPGYSVNFSQYTNYSAAFCVAYNKMVDWEADSRPPCVNNQQPPCKELGQLRVRVSWYTNVCDPLTNPFVPTLGTKLFERGLFNPDTMTYNFHPLVSRRFIIGILPYSSEYWETLQDPRVPPHYLVETDSTGLCITLDPLTTTSWNYANCP